MEEEEYMWDGVNGVGKDQQTSEDSDKSGLDIQLPRHQSIQEVGLKADSEASADSLPGEINCQASPGDQVSSMWLHGARHAASVQSTPDQPRDYQTSFRGLSTATSSIVKKSFQSQNGSTHVVAPSVGPAKTTLASRGPTKQQRETHRVVPPSSQSPMLQLLPTPSVSASNSSQVVKNLTKQTESHADPRIPQLSRRSNPESYNKISQESLSTPQTAHLIKSQISQTPKHNPSSLMSSVQAGNNVPFPQNIQQETPESESSGRSQQSVVTQISGFADTSGTVPFVLPGSESPGQTSMSTLLASILKSGVLGSKSSAGTSLSSLDKGDLSAGAQPRPSGPSSQFLLSEPPVSVANVQLDRNGSSNYSQSNVELPQLPHGPPPTLVESSASLTSSVSNAVSDPVSKLLSSLVAKGLITASKEESPASGPSQTPPKSQIQSPPPASISSNLTVSAPVSLPIPFSSPNDEISLSKPAAKIPDALLQSTKEDIKDLAGFAFKPGVIRESNPGVISELLDDVPHQCGICGLRLKLPVQLDRHLEWHALRSPDGKQLHNERRWYLKFGEWITGSGSLPNCGMSAGPIEEGSSRLSKCTEVMVPADEGQCICVLCGQLFEDYYDEESDKWMFKGAVYMNSSSSESSTQSPIIHKNCMSESSKILRLTKDIKLEMEA